ncbi:hypothetical protein KI387_042026, partial [Taxus chinensis]
MELLCEYDMEIEHVKRREYVVAYALNRRRQVTLSTTVSTDLRSRILQQLPLDSSYITVRAEIKSQRSLEGNFDGFTLEADGLLRHRGKIYVPRDG